jgi:energy-coupling factor transport system substrate-specific component
MLATLMLLSKLLMEALPNVHLLGTLTMVYTIVLRWRALIPIYLYVFLNGLIAGFQLWWMPYLYIWTLLFGVVMLLPRTLSRRTRAVLYPIICALHGFLFGILYAPAQALMFGLDFSGMLAWIAAGLPFDLLHGVGNFVTGLLVLPLSEAFASLWRQRR